MYQSRWPVFCQSKQLKLPLAHSSGSPSFSRAMARIWVPCLPTLGPTKTEEEAKSEHFSLGVREQELHQIWADRESLLPASDIHRMTPTASFVTQQAGSRGISSCLVNWKHLAKKKKKKPTTNTSQTIQVSQPRDFMSQKLSPGPSPLPLAQKPLPFHLLSLCSHLDPQQCMT